MASESWHDLTETVTAAEEAVKAIIPPPVPDNGWSEQVLKAVQGIEGLRSIMRDRQQQEDEQL